MEFYPPKYWGLDPIYHACVKLSIADVLNLTEHPTCKGIFCISNHPISRVCVIGDVVLIDRKYNFMGYGVDDSTGVIQCYQWCDEEQQSLHFSLGQLVLVIGRITVFREERQIQIDTMVQQLDPNAEVMHWLEVSHLKNTYSQPFIIPSDLLPGPSIAQPSTKVNPTDVVCDAVMEYLKQPSFLQATFTLQDLKKDEKLLLILNKTLKDKLSDDHQHNMIPVDQLLSLSVSHLVEQGQLIVNHHHNVTDQPTTYEVLSLDVHIKPVILKIIQEQSQSHPSGVHINVILQNLKLQEHLSHVPNEMVKRTINKLEDNSDIYETASNSYRIVN